MANRSASTVVAYALVDEKNKLPLWDARAQIFWMKSVAKAEAARRNELGYDVSVEKITLTRAPEKRK